jgi:uncharacterized protein (DUF2141 family)
LAAEREGAGRLRNQRYVFGLTMATHPYFCWGRLAFAGILVSGVVQAEPSANTTTISVNVGPLRSSKGSLGCRLYASAEGFPRAAGLVSRRVKIAGASARCVFDDVAPGTYAVVVLHDENDNRVCDKNRLGIPVEGYGVSNNHTYALSAPVWHESKFVVESGKARALSISLRY